MIEAWTWPAYVAVLIGGVVFVALFVPILIWESRRIGQIRAMRVVGAALVAVYGVALIAYTLLPLPDAQWCASNPVPGRNLQLGAFVEDLLDYYRSYGAARLLRSFVFLQVAFNVVLFIPFGALWRRYFGGGIITATILGFLTSCVIEVTQTTGALGLFPCRYRVGDVDDILMNTVGAFLGATLAAALFFFLPEPREASRRRGEARPVTRRRRLVGMLIDYALLVGVQMCLRLGWRVTEVYLLGANPENLDSGSDSFWTGALAFLIVVVPPVLSGSGASLGQRAVWLEPRFLYPTFGRKVRRSLTGFGGWALLTTVSTWPGLPQGVAGGLNLAASLLVVVTLVLVVTDRSARGLSLRATSGEMADSRAD